MMEENIKNLLDQLHAIEALKFGDFTLANGSKSTFYIDLRFLPSFPDVFTRVIHEMADYCNSKLIYDSIIGIPIAGIPFGTAISWLTKKPYHLMRKTPKSHGLKKYIEGPSIKNKEILLIDDLISSGHSKEFAIENIRNEGGKVTNLLVLINRGIQNFTNWEAQWGVKLHALYTIPPEVIEYYRINYTG